MEQKRNFWISVFQRSGQRFLCSACGFAGDFNSFRLGLSGTGTEVRFFCPSCEQGLVFDTATKTMRTGGGEMIHPEVSLSGRWGWLHPKPEVLATVVTGAVILLLVYSFLGRLESRIRTLDGRLRDLATGQVHLMGLGGQVDLAFPGFQEIGAGYAVFPKSASRESTGVRIRGVVVNEKAFTVDAKFRITQSDHSQAFFVENVAPGTGETFDVFLSGATDTSGKVTVEVVETNLRLE